MMDVRNETFYYSVTEDIPEVCQSLTETGSARCDLNETYVVPVAITDKDDGIDRTCEPLKPIAWDAQEDRSPSNSPSSALQPGRSPPDQECNPASSVDEIRTTIQEAEGGGDSSSVHLIKARHFLPSNENDPCVTLKYDVASSVTCAHDVLADQDASPAPRPTYESAVMSDVPDLDSQTILIAEIANDESLSDGPLGTTEAFELREIVDFVETMDNYGHHVGDSRRESGDTSVIRDQYPQNNPSLGLNSARSFQGADDTDNWSIITQAGSDEEAHNRVPDLVARDERGNTQAYEIRCTSAATRQIAQPDSSPNPVINLTTVQKWEAADISESAEGFSSGKSAALKGADASGATGSEGLPSGATGSEGLPSGATGSEGLPSEAEPARDAAAVNKAASASQARLDHHTWEEHVLLLIFALAIIWFVSTDTVSMFAGWIQRPAF
ncbi:hypothetical protein BIW11_07611 [Tropilaelaps mercedesae]|uniref:Uncharacterized protein n=1 Tax=Tropilaelaps mercedesae TaxID=418985 RepID=A0A1V9XTD3_9ACAR|nr:hypothetical protein BIW11_07611 [Tropilaelaps mercedesae]